MKPQKCENSDNDVSWYAKSTQLLNDAASINTTNVSGYPINIVSNTTGGKFTYNPKSKVVPGIIGINIVPSIGAYDNGTGTTDPVTATSAVNLAAKNIYSYVRHANSGSANYESPDLMMAILAADQVFSAIAMGIRAYGIAMNYDQRNRYTPIAMLKAMGFNPEDVISNMAQFRFYINSLIARASVIWVPSDMSIVNRHYWMYSNVYRDSEDTKAQFYLFTADNFMKFEPKASQTGSSLSVVPWMANGGNHTIAEYYNTVTSLLDPIISDEDLGIMFGDMLKAYGASNLFTINQIPDNYVIMPVHNPEVMQQIHNSCSVTVDPSAIKQRNGIIYQEFGVNPRQDVRGFFKPLNFWDHSPSPAEVMIATRLRAYVSAVNYADPKKIVAGVACGTEYVRAYTLWYYDQNGSLTAVNFSTFNSTTSIGYDDLAMITKFDWAPAVVTFLYTAGDQIGNDTYQIYSLHMDLDNYTELDSVTLDKMNTTALFSEFGVPKAI